VLATRLLTVAVLGPVVLVVAVVGEPWLSVLLGLVIFLAMVELIALLDAAAIEPPQVLTLAAGFVVGTAGLVAANEGLVGGALSDLLRATATPGLAVIALAGSTVVLGMASFARGDPRTGFLSWSASTFGVAYVGLLVPAIAIVGHLAPAGGSAATKVGVLSLGAGAAWMLTLIAIVWGYDTGAYLTGRWLGRHRLIDHISPSKTVEGLVGGLVLATLAAGLGTWLTGLEPWHALVLGPVIGMSAQAGDLAESLIKRAAGRKESGFLIPGHGGVLDRIDSFLFAAPVLLGYALLLGGVSA
jgi:phosphatidate cytidylyltransferase